MSDKLFTPDNHEIREFSWLNPECKILSTGTVKLNLDFGQSQPLECEFHVLPGVDINLIGIGTMAYFNIILFIYVDNVLPKGFTT